MTRQAAMGFGPLALQILSATLLTSTLLLPVAKAKKGLYFGFSLGGAVVSGETAVTMSDPGKDPDFAPTCITAGALAPCSDPPFNARTNLTELFSTDVGGGFAAELRVGYNILGFVAIELDVGGSGNGLSDSDELEGQVGIFGLLRLFPAQLFKEVEDRWWDPYIYIGGGAYFMAYHPDAHPPVAMVNDGRAWWTSSALKYGLGCDFYVVKFFSLGVDFAFVNGFHETFWIDHDDEIKTTAKDGASSFAFQPTAKLTFHFLTD